MKINIDLLKACIEKALQKEDFVFLENLLDYLSIDSIEEIQDENLRLAFYEYIQGNYEKAKYFAYICQLKNIKQANVILDLVECNLTFNSPSDEIISNRVISLLIKKSDDIFIISFLILKYVRYLIDKKEKEIDKIVLNLINKVLKFSPQSSNLKILKFYLYSIFDYDIEENELEEVLKSLPNESREILFHLLK